MLVQRFLFNLFVTALIAVTRAHILIVARALPCFHAAGSQEAFREGAEVVPLKLVAARQRHACSMGHVSAASAKRVRRKNDVLWLVGFEELNF